MASALTTLLVAARDSLKNAFSWNSSQCRVMPNGQPIPVCGKFFVALFATSWSPQQQDLNQGLDESFALNCCVTHRMDATPLDRVGENIYILGTDAVTDLCEKIMEQIHLNYTLLDAANTALSISGRQLTEPFRWLGTDATPEIKGGEWFSAAPDEAVGLVMTARFGMARRMRKQSQLTQV